MILAPRRASAAARPRRPIRNVGARLGALLLVALVVAAPASAIGFAGGAADGNGEGAASLVIPAPVGVTKDQVLVAHVAFRGGTDLEITAPAGWTLVLRTDDDTNVGQATYVKVATAAEPADYTWTFNASRPAAGAVVGYDGVDTGDPVDAVGAAANATGSIVAAPSIVTTVDGARLVGSFAIARNATGADAAAMTVRADSNANATTDGVTSLVADEAQTTAGPTGMRDATYVEGDAVGIGQLLALRPVTVAFESDASSGTEAVAAPGLTVLLSSETSSAVSVDYAATGGTATGGVDYTLAAGTLTFAAGETSKTIVLAVTQDEVDELDETVIVTLSDPVDATLGSTTTHTYTIVDDENATVSVDDATTDPEGDAGTTTTDHAVTLSKASDRSVTVDYATSDAGATAGADYNASAGTLTFAPGETAKVVSVDVLGDLIDEDDETYTVTLSSPTNAAVDDGEATGTIVDDDATTISISDESTDPEGDAGVTTTDHTVTLSVASEDTVTVDYATSDGTATAGEDYTATGGTLTFLPGDTVKTIGVDVAGDELDEVDETYTITLSDATNAAIADDEATGTIVDDDTTGLSVGDATVTPEGDAGTTTATHTVTLDVANDRTVTVDYETSDVTATAGDDYTATAGTLTFLPGETVKTISVDVAGDLLDELDETYKVTLSAAANATIADAEATGTIIDDDTTTISISDNITDPEGDAGVTVASHGVTLTLASDRPVTVDFATSDVTATAGADYNATAGTVTFAPGETVKSIDVDVLGDTVDELDETYKVTLSGAVNATIADPEATGTIVDDDNTTVSISDETTDPEGDAGTTTTDHTVTLSKASDRIVTVDYTTNDGTAAAPGDYAATAGTLTFLPGETVKTIGVDVVGDVLDELDETYNITLSGATNAVIVDDEGAGTIVDDDATNISVSDNITDPEGDAGTTAAAHTVTLSTPNDRPVSVDYAFADVSAVNAVDYNGTDGSVTFAPGETSKVVTVDVFGDLLDEDDETYTITLSAPINATLADALGLGTIVDDDSAAISIADQLTLPEGNNGTTKTNHTVSLNGPSIRVVTVDYASADVTATAGVDYNATAGTLTFAPGETSKNVTIDVIGDELDEIDETYQITLSGATNATIDDGLANGTIVDDDTTRAYIEDTVVDPEGNAGLKTAEHSIKLLKASDLPITVDYATSDGTAKDGLDYIATAGTVSFAPGETTKIFTVDIIGDLLDELNEVYHVTLADPVNTTLFDGNGTGTIVDDDLASLSINDVAVTEGNSGSRPAIFTISMSTTSDRDVSVSYATRPVTATAGTDYTDTAGTVTIPAGTLSKTATAPVKGDRTVEADETFEMILTSPVNAVLGDAVGVGTIRNDDTAAPPGGGGGGGGDPGPSGPQDIELEMAPSNPPAGATWSGVAYVSSAVPGQRFLFDTQFPMLPTFELVFDQAIQQTYVTLTIWPSTNAPPGAPGVPNDEYVGFYIDVDILGDETHGHLATFHFDLPPGAVPDVEAAAFLHLDGTRWSFIGPATLVADPSGQFTGSISTACCSLFALAFDDAAPTLTLLAPTDPLANVVTIVVEAADLKVERVDFLVSRNIEFSDTEAPYEMRLNTRGFEDGTYTITVVATDWRGRTTEEGIVRFFQNSVVSTSPSDQPEPTPPPALFSNRALVGWVALLGFVGLGAIVVLAAVRRRVRSGPTEATYDSHVEGSIRARVMDARRAAQPVVRAPVRSAEEFILAKQARRGPAFRQPAAAGSQAERALANGLQAQRGRPLAAPRPRRSPWQPRVPEVMAEAEPAPERLQVPVAFQSGRTPTSTLDDYPAGAASARTHSPVEEMRRRNAAHGAFDDDTKWLLGMADD